MKILNFGPEGSICKFGAKGGMVGEEINITEKKSSTLYRNKRKDDLKASLKSAPIACLRVQTCHRFLGRESLEPLLDKSLQGNWFLQIHFAILSLLGTERMLQSWPPRELSYAFSDSRSWHHPYGVDFTGIQM